MRFIAVTHPHADHCNGISDLVERFDAEEFFVFDSFQEQDLFGFFKLLLKHRYRDAVEEALDLPVGTVALQLAKLSRHLESWRRGRSHGIWRLLSRRSRNLCRGEVTLRFLTPGDHQSGIYKSKLNESIRALVGDGPVLNKEWRPAVLNHNLVSGSILVQYGKTSFLLMADGEVPLWRELLADLTSNDERLPAPVQLIKVAHHGSFNGYVKELYEAVCSPDRTLAVVTPFDRHQSPLPSEEGVVALRSHVTSLFCTNRAAATRSSGLAWEPVRSIPRESYPAMPQRWITVLRDQPELRHALAPDLGGPPYLEPQAALPPEFLPECTKNPELLQLLHPDLVWAAGPRGASFDEFRMSFYFDRDGQEVESLRHVGGGAGRLAASRH